MAVMQKTIKNEVTLTGKGLHTGVNVSLTFKSAPDDFGYAFKRIDLEGQPTVKAIAENVVETSRGTTIAEKGAVVHTIEHVMAACVAVGIDNLLIEIDGPETPIMDGSSAPFLRAIKEGGMEEQEAERDYFEIKEKITYTDIEKGVEISIYPDDHLSAHVLVDYNSKVLGHQYASLDRLSQFEKEIAPCRTFVFFHEMEYLLKNNLIKGGDLENAIVVMEKPVPQIELDRMADLFNKPRIKVKPEGILNNLDLQFDNEPARHKLLDLVGDLALIGVPIKGRIVAKCPGHFVNNEFARMVKKVIRQSRTAAPEYDPNQPAIKDVVAIQSILPHRSPFLLIDKIIKQTETEVVGVKNVTMNEPYFIGHFPDQPVMPGVLQIEAMAQVGGVLVLSTVPDPENYLTYFLKIDNVRFKRKVVPGDTLVFKMVLTSPIRRGIANMHGQAFVGDTLVCEGDLMAQISKAK